jgi:hypothetical protein
MKNKDILIGSVLFLFGAMVVILIPSQIKNVGSVAVGPRSFPYFISFLLMSCSLILIVQEVKKVRKERAEGKVEQQSSSDDTKGLGIALLFYLTVVVYAFSMKWLGFLVSSVVFLPVMLYMLGVRKKLLYLILLPIIAAVYYVFQVLLHVQLP